jgi:hypothetical protein
MTLGKHAMKSTWKARWGWHVKEHAMPDINSTVWGTLERRAMPDMKSTVRVAWQKHAVGGTPRLAEVGSCVGALSKWRVMCKCDSARIYLCREKLFIAYEFEISIYERVVVWLSTPYSIAGERSLYSNVPPVTLNKAAATQALCRWLLAFNAFNCGVHAYACYSHCAQGAPMHVII